MFKGIREEKPLCEFVRIGWETSQKETKQTKEILLEPANQRIGHLFTLSIQAYGMEIRTGV